MPDIHKLCVNTIRTLSIDMVQKANSGHPGLPLGAAPIAYILWTRFLKHNPKDPLWPDRDRFILSAGHGSALLYSLLCRLRSQLVVILDDRLSQAIKNILFSVCHFSLLIRHTVSYTSCVWIIWRRELLLIETPRLF